MNVDERLMNIDERLKYLRNYVIFFMALTFICFGLVIAFAYLDLRGMMWMMLVFGGINLALGERTWQERFRLQEFR